MKKQAYNPETKQIITIESTDKVYYESIFNCGNLIRVWRDVETGDIFHVKKNQQKYYRLEDTEAKWVAYSAAGIRGMFSY